MATKVSPLMSSPIVPRVLCVDDDEYYAAYLKAVLEDIGIEVDTAVTGADALDILKSARDYHLVILDVLMPDISGFELAEQIQSGQQENPVPFIFLTSLTSTADSIKGYELGAFDYICKPIDPKQFRSKVRSLLNRLVDHQQIQQKVDKYKHHFTKLQNIILSSRDALIEINEDLRIVFANPTAVKILDLPATNYHQVLISDLLSSEEVYDLNWDNLIGQAREAVGNPEKTPILNFWHRRLDGKQRLLTLRVMTTTASPDRFFAQLCDITPQGDSAEFLFDLNSVDSLTGLANHSYFSRCCDLLIERNEPNGQPLGLIIINIERFSSLNDRLGHEIGDKILKRIAIRIKTSVRSSDLISRFGNDEYAIVIEKLPNWGMSRTVTKIIEKLQAPLALDDDIQVNVSVNVGIAMYPDCGSSFSLLYQCAKIALDKARADPVRSYYFYNNQLDEVSRFYMKMVEQFDNALRDQEFYVVYQPQYDLHSGNMIGAEALVRWKSKTEGVVPPAVFIPVAEQSSHIFTIGDIVIERALAEIASIQPRLPPEFKLALNLSAKQLTANNINRLKLKIFETLQRNNLSNELVEFEITEHSILGFDDEFMEELHHLKTQGFSISLDDFGTGFSSLTYVQKLPIDRLKIDMSFIRMIGQDTKTEEIIHLILGLASSLGFNVVAEGIETVEQLEFLLHGGCHAGQGYLFSKPVAMTELENLLGATPPCFLKLPDYAAL